jgi:hypothetical protein
MLTFTLRWFSLDPEGRLLLFCLLCELFYANRTITYLLKCVHAIHWPLVVVGLWGTAP